MKRVTISFEDGEQTVTMQGLFPKKFELHLCCQSLLSCSTGNLDEFHIRKWTFFCMGSIIVTYSICDTVEFMACFWIWTLSEKGIDPRHSFHWRDGWISGFISRLGIFCRNGFDPRQLFHWLWGRFSESISRIWTFCGNGFDPHQLFHWLCGGFSDLFPEFELFVGMGSILVGCSTGCASLFPEFELFVGMGSILVSCSTGNMVELQALLTSRGSRNIWKKRYSADMERLVVVF